MTSPHAVFGVLPRPCAVSYQMSCYNIKGLITAAHSPIRQETSSATVTLCSHVNYSPQNRICVGLHANAAITGERARRRWERAPTSYWQFWYQAVSPPNGAKEFDLYL